MSKKAETELIVVEQLPVIKDSLLAVKGKIEARVSEALSLVCTEETYKKIKEVRSALNKEYAELEKRRKEVKQSILKPYEDFEGIYKECAGDIYARADRELGQKIREVEDGLKAQKIEDLTKYFAEYRESVQIPEQFVRVEAAGIKVGLSDSRASLHKQAAAFLDRIASDLKVIDTMESRDEILAEYAIDYNLSRSMLTVDNRHKAIEAERARREEVKAKQEAVQTAVEAVKEQVAEAIQPPVRTPVKEEAPKVFETTFKVRGTIEQLKALKQFLNEGGYDYE